MDPDACLTEIRALVARLRKSRGEPSLILPEFQDGTEELLERVEALDEWLSKGGFPPQEWVATKVLIR